jgi:Domain of unknown function (DUF4124)
MRKLVLILFLASVAATSFGQTYKWRDAAGNVQYSDTPPPPGAKDVQQLRRSGSAAAPAAAAKSLAEQDADFRKRAVEKQEAETKQAKTVDDERTRARNCEQAKVQLAALESGARMVQMNAVGERVPLDDAERDRAKQDAQRAVESWCSK